MANSHFSILEASVILSSQDEDKVVDIRGNVLEINLFENLYKPYVDGTLVVLDDFGLRTSMNTQGTERLKLVLGNGDDLENPKVVKYFFFKAITDSKKVSERSEVLAVDLIEEHVYINSIKSISKSYTGKLEDIATSIVETELGKQTFGAYFSGSVQGERKVIVPYISPLEAAQWIITRATTRTGSPLFYHATIFNRDLILSDLDTLLGQPVINENLPARYSSSINSISQEEESLREYFEIKKVSEVGADDALALYEAGSIGSFYGSLDAGSGNFLGSHLSIRDTLEEFYANDILSPSTTQSVFDPSLEIQGKLSDEYDAVHVHQVTSQGTYNQYRSYHDETPLVDANNNIIESRLKVKNKLTRALMRKNVIDIEMAGALFFDRTVSVGRKMRCLFLNPNVAGDNKSLDQQIDNRKSGDYLILAISHRMAGEDHVASLRLSKLGELPKDFGVL